jgi:hypothetical protein
MGLDVSTIEAYTPKWESYTDLATISKERRESFLRDTQLLAEDLKTGRVTHGGWRILGKLSGSQIPIHYDPRNYQNGYGDILTFYREIYTRDDPIKLWWSENSLRYLEQEDTISRAICSLPAGKAIGPDHLALDSIPQGYLFWWTRTHLRQLLT